MRRRKQQQVWSKAKQMTQQIITALIPGCNLNKWKISSFMKTADAILFGQGFDDYLDSVLVLI